ncbi:predicted protein [Coccidioides posadasii str. Silveira]|uniref:Predicted protein n=1 Tax=Coccidioides posadasii (strain RMSCC 757 / Silveira) TaxID=443226 RepID=E9CSH9_COCPS|nr:predicted protein [Coccidioides posadasii str. Silveira]
MSSPIPADTKPLFSSFIERLPYLDGLCCRTIRCLRISKFENAQKCFKNTSFDEMVPIDEVVMDFVNDLHQKFDLELHTSTDEIEVSDDSTLFSTNVVNGTIKPGDGLVSVCFGQ